MPIIIATTTTTTTLQNAKNSKYKEKENENGNSKMEATYCAQVREKNGNITTATKEKSSKEAQR